MTGDCFPVSLNVTKVYSHCFCRTLTGLDLSFIQLPSVVVFLRVRYSCRAFKFDFHSLHFGQAFQQSQENIKMAKVILDHLYKDLSVFESNLLLLSISLLFVTFDFFLEFMARLIIVWKCEYAIYYEYIELHLSDFFFTECSFHVFLQIQY